MTLTGAVVMGVRWGPETGLQMLEEDRRDEVGEAGSPLASPNPHSNSPPEMTSPYSRAVKLRHGSKASSKQPHSPRGLCPKTTAVLTTHYLLWLGGTQTLQRMVVQGGAQALSGLIAETCRARASRACENIFSRGTTFP